MKLRQITRPRSFWSGTDRVTGIPLVRLRLVPTLVAVLLAIPAFAFLPRAWQTIQSRTHWARLRDRTAVQAEVVERRWAEPIALRPSLRGDEPDTAAALRAHPLVIAVGSLDGAELWVRHGDELRPAADDPEAALFRRWILAAAATGKLEWHPGPGENPEQLRQAVGVFRQDPWFTIRRWRVGSPEVERHLRACLPGESSIRVGLMRTDPAEVLPRTSPPPAWGEPPNLQVNLYRGRTSLMDITSGTFGDDWTFLAIESERVQLQMKRDLRRWALQADAAVALALAAAWLGVYAWRRRRLKEARDRDRLASLAHSLKTPLGLVKLRCDELAGRERQEPEEVVRTLLRVSEDVGTLNAFIEQSLRGLGWAGEAEPSQVELVSGPFFRKVADDLTPAFQVEDRRLELDLSDARARANAILLRTALVTLLENALEHGTGAVALSTSRRRRHLRVEVRNGGPGLNAAELDRLARPFAHFVSSAHQASATEARGLGLFLLAQVAAREGWGLAIASGPGEGFAAVLELPAG